jgi:hypothetical protein
VGGLGAAALLTGGLLGALSIAAYGESSRDGCSSQTNLCPNLQGVGARSTALDRANAATWLFVSGGIALTSGIVLWVATPSSPAAGRIGLTASATTAAVRCEF